MIIALHVIDQLVSENTGIEVPANHSLTYLIPTCWSKGNILQLNLNTEQLVSLVMIYVHCAERAQTHIYTQSCRVLCSTSSGMSITSALFVLLLFVCLAWRKAGIGIREVAQCQWHSSCLPPHYLQPSLSHLALKWRNVFKASSNFTGALTTSSYADVAVCVVSVCARGVGELLCASWVTACYCSWKTLLMEKCVAWSLIFTARTKGKVEAKVKSRKNKS